MVSTWTVYESPRDFPGLFVARRWEVGGGRARATNEHVSATTLDELREKLPLGLVRIPRHPTDDAPIVEVWL